jgi:hypothetical protein
VWVRFYGCADRTLLLLLVKGIPGFGAKGSPFGITACRRGRSLPLLIVITIGRYSGAVLPLSQVSCL